MPSVSFFLILLSFFLLHQAQAVRTGKTRDSLSNFRTNDRKNDGNTIDRIRLRVGRRLAMKANEERVILKEDGAVGCVPQSSSNVLLYLRIGKAGSSSLKRWMSRAIRPSARLSFYEDTERLLAPQEEAYLVGNISILPRRYQAPRVIHIQHTYYLNFSRSGLEQVGKRKLRENKNVCSFMDQPHIVTMLRDPVERYISQYYYWRVLKNSFGNEVRLKGLSISDCMLPEKIENVPFGCPMPNYQTSYLCGSDPACTEPPNAASFLVASRNLAEHIDVACTVEEIEVCTRLLLALYPKWLMKGKRNEIGHMNKVNGKPKLQHLKGLIQRIREVHKYDLSLFEMAKKKLYTLAEKCSIAAVTGVDSKDDVLHANSETSIEISELAT